jgi:hypothetical protein
LISPSCSSSHALVWYPPHDGGTDATLRLGRSATTHTLAHSHGTSHALIRTACMPITGATGWRQLHDVASTCFSQQSSIALLLTRTRADARAQYSVQFYTNSYQRLSSEKSLLDTPPDQEEITLQLLKNLFRVALAVRLRSRNL